MRVTILLFHRVHPERDPLWDPMDPELFEKVLKYVMNKYTVISLNDFSLQPFKKYKKPALIITFDDGYKDFMDYALPILQKYAIPSSMFIVTDCVENNLPTWTHILEYLFSNTQKLKLKISDSGLLKEECQVRQWKDKQERIEYFKRLNPYLKTILNTKRKLIVNQVIQTFDDVNLPKRLVLTWDEVNQIKNAGIEIGSHSVSHPSLANIEDDKELEFELFHSAKLIEEKTGQFPMVISYPFGSYDNRVKNISRQVGYKLGLAVGEDIYDSLSYDNFKIPRIQLYNENFFKTKLRINGTITKLKKLRYTR